MGKAVIASALDQLGEVVDEADGARSRAEIFRRLNR